MRWELQASTRQIIVIFFILPALLSCGRAKEEPVTTDAQGRESSTPSGAVAGEDENQVSSSSPTLPPPQPPDTIESLTSSAGSNVIIGGDLGLTVSGEGTGDPNRSSAELEQQLHAFLPQLREVYDQELSRDPHGMGSLDVKMTIEPGGSVSELRFPLKRMSSERLTSAVYDVMRAWQFSPADHTVDLRYRMLLVPAGIDPVSIGRWEQHLADRVEVDRSEKVSSTAAPSRTLGHLMEKYGFDRSEKVSPTVAPAEVTSSSGVPTRPVVTATKRAGESVASERQQDAGVSETAEQEEQSGEEPSQPRILQRESENPRRFLAQWYRVTRPTALYATPNSSAKVITRLQPGKSIWVVGIVDGKWFEIRSVKGRRPGFLPREYAQPERRERARNQKE